MPLRIIIVLAVFMSSQLAQAQEASSPSWSLSHFRTDIVEPGWQIGFDYPLRVGRNGQKLRIWSTGLLLSYYRDRRSHIGLAIAPSITYRRVLTTNGRLFKLSLSLGYHRSFIDGDVYQVDENNQVLTSSGSGQNTLWSQLSLAWGQDLRWRRQLPFAWQLGLGCHARFPVNHQAVPGLHVEAGLTYYLTFNTPEK